jgi:glyoxylase-like metal-dependent hydrolase (beta-lactamase superfamily II)
VPGLTYALDEVAPGVFVAIAQGVPYYVANSVVVVGEDAVLLVDSSGGTNEARALREAIRRVTDRPVRYVVDTHFHFDHALGHAAFPEALTIGHDATRAGLVLGVRQPTLARNLTGMTGRIADLETEAATEKDAARKDQLRGQATALETYRRQLAALTPSPSNLTFGQSLTVWLGNREVACCTWTRHGGRAVCLPKERLVCTGDLFNGDIGYMGDAYVDEWADALGRLAALDFETVVAGHGKPFRGKEALPAVQACLRDLWRQAESLKTSGLSAAEAASRIDLTAHAGRFPRLAEKGFEPLAVERIYAVIDERQARAAEK